MIIPSNFEYCRLEMHSFFSIFKCNQRTTWLSSAIEDKHVKVKMTTLCLIMTVLPLHSALSDISSDIFTETYWFKPWFKCYTFRARSFSSGQSAEHWAHCCLPGCHTCTWKHTLSWTHCPFPSLYPCTTLPILAPSKAKFTEHIFFCRWSLQTSSQPKKRL